MTQGLHLVLGDEPLLVERAVAVVLREAHAQDMFSSGAVAAPVVSRLRAGDATAALLAELTSPSLFAEQRVLVLDEAQQAGAEPCERILDLARAQDESVTLVVCHSGAARNRPLVNSLRELGAQAHDCAKLTRAGDRLDFVRAEFRAHGVRVPPAAAQALLDSVGSDLRELARACSQLASDTGGVVNVEAVHQYFQGKAEVSGFDIADLVFSGETEGALVAARWALLSGVAPVLIADALAESALSLARVGAAGRASPEALASSLGMPPWRAKKIQAQWRIWSSGGKAERSALGRADRALRLVAGLNADVKGAAADVEFAVERAVRELANLARSA
ncbi:MAG: DNA polymerase III subunit delta [Segniliparus sp.]|uniref:DNA polymerase III subunit delta n=1 Tax=Segniliparus sp. TaxID=2804064 RepID=UPI003F31493D